MKNIRKHQNLGFPVFLPSMQSFKGLLTVHILLALFMLFDTLVITVCADSSDILSLQISGSFEVTSARQMLDSINDLRANDAWYWNSSDTEKIVLSDLTPLVYDYELERVAMQRAAELAVLYAHLRPNGEQIYSAYPDQLLMRNCGENIAYGQTNAVEVFTDWAEADLFYDGQGHRRNMLDPGFKSVGIGCFECNGVLFWTQEFSSEVTNAVPDPLEPPVNVDVLQENIDKAVLSRNRVDLMTGQTIPLSEIGFYIIDAYTPNISVPCMIAENEFNIADTDIAEISDGMITAVQEGNTVLTASVSGLRAEIPLYVSNNNVISMSLNEAIEISVPAGETKYFSFIPEETASYTFFSSGDYDTYCDLYDQDNNILDSDDDSGDFYNFSLTKELTAGTQYYYGVNMYDDSISGVITVWLIKDNQTNGDFSYVELDDGSISITGCSLTGDVVIPDAIDGCTVTNLASELFYGVSGITSVTIPATVTFFGNDKNDNIWDYVFSYCYDLKDIIVDNDNPSFCSIDGVLYEKDGKTLINYPCDHDGEVYHVDADFLCCTSFASCHNLKFLFMDNPNTSWYTHTFYNTGNLTSFFNAGGITSKKVADETAAGHEYNVDATWCRFADVKDIQRTPDNLLKIENDAFQNTGIKYLFVPDNCRKIEEGAFIDSDLEYICVSGSTVIEDYAFGDSVVIEKR